MGFIKGKAYAIINSMAKKGNTKAKNLLLTANNLKQEQVDDVVGELLSTTVEKKPIKEEEELKLVKEKETEKEEKRAEKSPKEIEDKEEKVEKFEEEEPKNADGDLLEELELFIKEEKKLLEKYKENGFSSELKPIILAKEKFIEKLEKVGEKDE